MGLSKEAQALLDRAKQQSQGQVNPSTESAVVASSETPVAPAATASAQVAPAIEQLAPSSAPQPPQLQPQPASPQAQQPPQDNTNWRAKFEGTHGALSEVKKDIVKYKSQVELLQAEKSQASNDLVKLRQELEELKNKGVQQQPSPEPEIPQALVDVIGPEAAQALLATVKRELSHGIDIVKNGVSGKLGELDFNAKLSALVPTLETIKADPVFTAWLNASDDIGETNGEKFGRLQEKRDPIAIKRLLQRFASEMDVDIGLAERNQQAADPLASLAIPQPSTTTPKEAPRQIEKLSRAELSDMTQKALKGNLPWKDYLAFLEKFKKAEAEGRVEP